MSECRKTVLGVDKSLDYSMIGRFFKYNGFIGANILKLFYDWLISLPQNTSYKILGRVLKAFRHICTL